MIIVTGKVDKAIQLQRTTFKKIFEKDPLWKKILEDQSKPEWVTGGWD